MRIIKGDKYDEITEALEHTSGFCPCVPKYMWYDHDGHPNKEFQCLCTEFLNQTKTGHCKCKRYKKVEVQ